MSLAIKFGNENNTNELSGFIYFDVVKTFTKSYTGTVTKHPVDSGASITDHFISNNATIQIEGVISYLDFSGIPYLISVDGERPLNAQQIPDAISISDIGGGLKEYLESVASEFYDTSGNTVTSGGSTRTDYKGQIISLLEQVMSGIVYDSATGKNKNRMTLITLYEFDGYNITSQVSDLVMTSFVAQENAESGDALVFSMGLEKVRFVTLDKTEVPSSVSGKLKAKRRRVRWTVQQRRLGIHPLQQTMIPAPELNKQIKKSWQILLQRRTVQKEGGINNGYFNICVPSVV